jgi:hypothetical protein
MEPNEDLLNNHVEHQRACYHLLYIGIKNENFN